MARQMTGVGMGAIKSYIDQWLATASQGNIVAEYAFATDRIAFACHICMAMYTFSTPIDASTMDYGAQEFVALHAHKGGHKDKVPLESKAGKQTQIFNFMNGVPEPGSPGWTSYDIKIVSTAAKPKPVTLDFKPVKTKDTRRFR
jgi:hypothetical protein